METQSALPPVLRPKEAAKVCGFSLATFWNKTNPKSRHHDPDFPKPFKLSERATAIKTADLLAWIEKRANQNTGA